MYYAAWCVKLWILNKFIDYILYIDTFEQHFFVIKGMLQSPRIEDHMKTIGIEQSLSNGSSFEYKYLNNIKIYINIQVSVMTNKTSSIFFMLLWCLLQIKSQVSVQFYVKPKQQSKNQVLGNHCVYSLTYLMLKIKLKTDGIIFIICLFYHCCGQIIVYPYFIWLSIFF